MVSYSWNWHYRVNDLIWFSQLSSSHTDTLPKKYTNSDLRLNLKADSGRRETEDNASIGGLNDNDAYATRPNYTRHKALPPAVQFPAQLRHDPTHKNEVQYFIYP